MHGDAMPGIARQCVAWNCGARHRVAKQMRGLAAYGVAMEGMA